MHPLLPPHDILLFDRERPYGPIFQSGSLGELPAAAADFAALAFPARGTAPDVASTTVAPDLASASHSARIRSTLQVAFPASIQRDWHGKWQVFRDRLKTRVLYWDVIEDRYILAVYINADLIGRDFVPRLLAATWQFHNSGIASIPSNDDSITASSFITRRSRLFGKITEARRFLLRPGFRFGSYGTFAVGASPLSPGQAGRIVCVVPMSSPDEGEAPGETAKKAVLYLLLAVCLFGLVRPAQTGGERELSVRFLLLATFIAAAVLPLAGMDYLAGRFLTEYFRNQKREIADTLHRELASIDENGRHNLSSYTAYLKSLNSIDAFARHLPESSPASLSTSDLFLRSLTAMDRKESIIYHIFLTIPRIGPHVHLTRLYKELIVNRERNLLISRFIQRAGSRFRQYDGNSDIAAAPTPPVNAAPQAMDGLEKEMVNEMLLSLVGPGTFINLLHYPERVFEMSVLFNTTFQVETVIRSGGRVEHLLYWFWNSYSMERRYLNEFLPRFDRPDRPSDLNAGMTGLQTLTEFFPERMNRTPASFTALREVLSDVHTSRGTIRKEEQAGNDRLLVEAYPAKHLMADLAGQKSISHLESERKALEVHVSLLLMSLLGIAVITGVLGGLYFILPLQRIIGGIESIRNEEFQARLDDSRNDEFGSLASAFNRLARGLEEGRFLRRYVSDSARKAAQDGRSGRMNDRNGAMITATILFSSLHEFSEFQARSDARIVFAILEQHLDIANEAVSEYGGEIDKVIGDKIMIVFRHDECGGDAKAVRSAFSAIASMRRIAAERGLYPGLCIGINTGAVVSGIVGSEETHLDYTVIGDPVNLAARLAAMAQRLPGCRTVVSGSTRAIIGDAVSMEWLGTTRVKGKSQEIETWLL